MVRPINRLACVVLGGIVTSGRAFLLALAYAGKWFMGMFIGLSMVFMIITAPRDSPDNPPRTVFILLAISASIAAALALWVFFSSLYGILEEQIPGQKAQQTEGTEPEDNSAETQHGLETE
ncbi:MAG TPA: hypothetical protein VHD60_00170 [Candidatus Saccharimonadales bacterium]|nr:hypothetical protein [Candidatus Saccharimonadales bacterium]